VLRTNANAAGCDREAPAAEVFGKVAEELANVLVDADCLWRPGTPSTLAP
jgi:hypothetical protein